MVTKVQIESCRVRARLPLHPDYTTRLWSSIIDHGSWSCSAAADERQRDGVRWLAGRLAGCLDDIQRTLAEWSGPRISASEWGDSKEQSSQHRSKLFTCSSRFQLNS
jgi:hypothetical protein